MPLNAYSPDYESVLAEDGRELGTVRGLSVDDLSFLVRGYLQHMQSICNLISDIAAGDLDFSSLSEDDIGKVLVQLITDSPGLVVSIIQRGADEPGEDAEIAIRAMSIGIQLKLLEKIFEKTFYEAGGVKKFIAGIGQMYLRVKPSKKAKKTAHA